MGNRLLLANNNKNSSSAAFQNMNNQVVQLDAQYDALPDKTPWLDYNEFLNGNWSPCYNCTEAASAKKLYRQYNYNRSLIGLTAVSAPIDPSEEAPEPLGLVTFINTPPSPPTSATIVAGPSPATIYVVAQENLGLLNPIKLITGAEIGSGVISPGATLDFLEAWYAFLGGVYTGGFDDVTGVQCFFTPNGTPGARTEMLMSG